MSNTNLRTEAEYRAEAAKCRQDAAESYERSQEDGIFSQFAATEMAHRYDYLASVVADGGKVTTLALFFNGKLASLEQRTGQYGFYWVLNQETTDLINRDTNRSLNTRYFYPSKAKNATDRDRAKGFTYGSIRVAVLETSASTVIESEQAVQAGDYEVVATDGAYALVDSDMAL